jgi:NitT/TauT family transport system substrate-binding protein
MRLRRFVGVLAALALSLASACDGRGGADSRVVRIGHFPNMTHAHALVARALAREGKGWFEERLGEGVRVEWFTYNAGPSAMEALLAGSLDATYVGPSPAINAHVRTGGAEVRVIAAAARGGSALVVRGDGTLREPQDFRGKRIATPQLGNTQDVACRAWLADHGLRTSLTGGDAFVVPTENPDQIPLFQRGDLDAAWTVEPWVSRLELEAKGRVLVEDRDALTTVLAASARFLGERPALARALAAAHAELTQWIARHPEEAKRLARAELAAETTRAPSVELLDRAWSRMRFDVAVAPAEFESFLGAARKVGFLRDARGLARLVEIPQ